MSTRKEQLNDFITFIDKTRNDVDNILKELGWNIQDTLKSFNKNEECRENKQHNENKTDPCYPPSFVSEHTVTINSSILHEILKTANKFVPEKFSDFQTNFTREQKLRLYEYIIEQTGKLSEPEVSVIFNQIEGLKKEMTFAEIVALKRDLKRRRLKYRTTKAPPLSHTEEVRNLIDLQMQALCQYLQPQGNVKYDGACDESRPGTSRDFFPVRNRIRNRSRSIERKCQKKIKMKHRSRSRERKEGSRRKHDHSKESTHRKKSSKKHRKRSRSRD